MAWFRAWLGDVAATGRPVMLVGFSGGAAFTGRLLLFADPQSEHAEQRDESGAYASEGAVEGRRLQMSVRSATMRP